MLFFILIIFSVGFIVIIMLVMKMMGQLNDRLRETSSSLQEAHKTVGDRLDSANRLFGDVQKSLGRLEETHKHIYEISKDISSLQQLLRAPKFRGEVGETLLGKLLEDILPKENVRIQHRFNTGDTVDAAVIIGKNILTVDAKFSWENFKKFSEGNSEEERKPYYRAFTRDVKNRVDEIAAKYILPDEGTFDFSLMYIPSEAIYYQVSRDEELTAYAHLKKVIFVSPNTFYAYLQVILYALKGVNIERNIQDIVAQLSRLQVDFRKFQEDFDLIGSHLSNATKKYNDARVKLEQYSDRLSISASTTLSADGEQGRTISTQPKQIPENQNVS